MPKTHITRSIHLRKPASEVFPLLSDFQNWPKWSPWLLVEPGAKLTFAPDGSAYCWNGELVGVGSMEKCSEDAPHSMGCTLKLLKPWKSTSQIEFRLRDVEDGCEVTWGMQGKLPFFMGWLKGMVEGMVGMDYERGLSLLKDLAEEGETFSSCEVIEHQPFEGFTYIGKHRTCPMKDISGNMDKDLRMVHSWSTQHGTEPAGEPFSIYHDWNMKTGSCTYTIGYPISGTVDPLPDGAIMGTLPSCDTFAVDHTGPYRHLGNAWAVAMSHKQGKKFTPRKGMDPVERYLTDPTKAPEKEILTRVLFPRT